MSGAQFRQYRKALGFQAQDVAREAGIQNSYVSLIETGQRRLTERMQQRLTGALKSLIEQRAKQLEVYSEPV